jgi:hypothetical protein
MMQYPEPPLTPEENTQRPVPPSYKDEDAYWDWVDQQVDRAKEDRMIDAVIEPEGPR